MGKGASAGGAGAVRGPPARVSFPPVGRVPPRGRGQAAAPAQKHVRSLGRVRAAGLPGCWSLKGCWVQGSVSKLNRKGLVVIRLEMRTFVYMF